MDRERNKDINPLYTVDIAAEESDIVTMINPNSEEDFSAEELPDELLILPIKNTVLFPGVVIPITVGREKSRLPTFIPTPGATRTFSRTRRGRAAWTP